MTKKGGVQQLQAEINTDEDLEKFLERPGLLVLDIYSEWCGPCLGMVGSLKKIKLELGGDNLNLAICKADTIDSLARFRNKSEPSWLFVTDGKAVNLMFGTNLPKLMKLIASELKLLGQPREVFYDIIEPLPEEVERTNILLAEQGKAREIEEIATKQKRLEYLNFCTDEITANLPEIGITIFGPQVNRDSLKKILEASEPHHLACKDRKVTRVSSEDMETLQYACNNPIDSDVLQQLYNYELLICCWKINEENNQSVTKVLNTFAQDLTTPKQKPAVLDEDGNEISADEEIPPLLVPMEVQVKTERIIVTKVSKEPSEEKDLSAIICDDSEDILLLENDNKQKDSEKESNGMKTNEPQQQQQQVETLYHNVSIPAIWTPGNQRTNATGIYVFFRNQTVQFLPPDPIPEPDHLIMTFDAYKKKDIFDALEKFPDDLLAYGYFSTNDPNTAELLATNTKNYIKRVPNVTDKLVVKISRITNNVLLVLSALGPSYVSPNTVVGKVEALKFFPEGYKVEEEIEEPSSEIKKPKRKGKKKKGQTEQKEEVPTSQEGEVDGVEGTDGTEDTEGEHDENADESAEGNTDGELGGEND